MKGVLVLLVLLLFVFGCVSNSPVGKAGGISAEPEDSLTYQLPVKPKPLSCYTNSDCFSKTMCRSATCLECNGCPEPTYENVCSCVLGKCKQTVFPPQPTSYCGCGDGTCATYESIESCQQDCGNFKDASKFDQREVFLIADSEEWQNILQLVPLTVWTDYAGSVSVNPLLVYHREPTVFDLDSSVHFLQLFAPTKLTIVADEFELQCSDRLDNDGDGATDLSDLDCDVVALLTENNDVSQSEIQRNANSYNGAGLQLSQIQVIPENGFETYWSQFSEVVLSENDYTMALMASTFASLKNAPLFVGSIPSGIENEKSVYLVGSVSCPPLAKECVAFNSVEQLQQEYVSLTGTDKLLMVNPKDLTGVFVSDSFNLERSNGSLSTLYSKDSLVAPILASAKHEVLLFNPLNASPDNSGCSAVPEITQNIAVTDALVSSFVNNNFSEGNLPNYLTVLASPKAIPESEYDSCSGGSQYRNQKDFWYGVVQEMGSEETINIPVLDSFGNTYLFWLKESDTRYWLSKFDLTGVKVFDKTVNFNSPVMFPDIFPKVSSNGSLFLVYSNGSSWFLKKLDASGNEIGSEVTLLDASTPNYSAAVQILLDSFDNLVLFFRDDYTASGANLYYKKVDSMGNELVPVTQVNSGRGWHGWSFLFDGTGTIYGFKRFYQSEGGPTHDLNFVKIGSNGQLLQEKTIFERQEYASPPYFFVNSQGNFVVLYNISPWTFPPKGLWQLFVLDNQGSILFETTNPSIDPLDPIINMFMDSDDRIHAVKVENNGIYHKTMDSNGGELSPYYLVGQPASSNTNYVKTTYSGNRVMISWENPLTSFGDYSWMGRMLDGLNWLSQWTFILNDVLNMKNGRIYGLTVSDSSSYIAGDVFFDYIKQELGQAVVNSSVFVASSFDYTNDLAQEVHQRTSAAGYNSVCYTHRGYAAPGELNNDGCRTGCTCSTYPPTSIYEHAGLIDFSDHGNYNGWGQTLYVGGIPWMDLPFAYAVGCSTGNFWEGGKDTFAPNFLRHGAMGYVSPVGLSSVLTQSRQREAIEYLTTNNGIALGDMILFQYLNLDSSGFLDHFLLYGDPTLEIRFAPVNWT